MKAPYWISRENIEWAARLYIYVRSRPLARYGGILVLGALTLYSNILQLIVVGIFLLLGKQLTIPDAPQGVFYTMIVAGFVLIVLDRVLPERTMLPTAYPHDEQLMRAIREVYTPALDDFLRTWAFGNGSFKYDILSPLDRIRSWQGSQHEFINSELNEAWRKVQDAGRALVREVGEKTIPARGSVDRITPFRDDENIDWHTQEMIDRCKALDDSADRVVQEWDRFDALARRQIVSVV
jgi:hypothetical protein